VQEFDVNIVNITAIFQIVKGYLCFVKARTKQTIYWEIFPVALPTMLSGIGPFESVGMCYWRQKYLWRVLVEACRQELDYKVGGMLWRIQAYSHIRVSYIKQRVAVTCISLIKTNASRCMYQILVLLIQSTMFLQRRTANIALRRKKKKICVLGLHLCFICIKVVELRKMKNT
jgi:hypothetical protein